MDSDMKLLMSKEEQLDSAEKQNIQSQIVTMSQIVFSLCTIMYTSSLYPAREMCDNLITAWHLMIDGYMTFIISIYIMTFVQTLRQKAMMKDSCTK